MVDNESFNITKTKILLVLLILTLTFIWGHSMVPKSVSADESGRALKLLYPLLSLFFDPKDITNHLVRKMAHFTEYAVLGMELRILVGMYRSNGKAALFNKEMVFIPAVAYAFFTSFIDETIQIFSGRGPQIADVWLDIFGAFCGAGIISLIGMRGRKSGISKS